MLRGLRVVLLYSLTEHLQDSTMKRTEKAANLQRISHEHVGDVLRQMLVDIALSQLFVDLRVILEIHVVVGRRARINVAIGRVVSRLLQHKSTHVVFSKRRESSLGRCSVIHTLHKGQVKKSRLTAEMMSHLESTAASFERKIGVAAERARRTGVSGVS